MSDKQKWPVVETWVGADGRQLIFELKDAYGQPRDVRLYDCTITATFEESVVLNAVALEIVDGENGVVRLMHGFTSAGELDAQIKLVNGVGDIDYSEEVTIIVKKVVGG